MTRSCAAQTIKRRNTYLYAGHLIGTAIANASPFQSWARGVCMLMPRRIRDLVGAISALAVIGVALMALNDPLRQSVGRFTGNIGDIRSIGPVSALSAAVADAFGVVRTFSADNTFLSAFLVVAAVLVVLMLRI
jgi:hypothetical protein